MIYWEGILWNLVPLMFILRRLETSISRPRLMLAEILGVNLVIIFCNRDQSFFGKHTGDENQSHLISIAGDGRNTQENYYETRENSPHAILLSSLNETTSY